MSCFQVGEGMTVAALASVHECFEVTENNAAFRFTANISAEHIEEVIRSFCLQLTAPCFFILESPCNKAIEDELRKTATSPFHCDVYYLDGLQVESLLRIIDTYGKFLIHDGMACFGFASHTTSDEIYLGRYNVVALHTSNRERYEQFFLSHTIPKEQKITTVTETFTHARPGQARTTNMDGMDIQRVIDELTSEGLYFAERREQKKVALTTEQ